MALKSPDEDRLQGVFCFLFPIVHCVEVLHTLVLKKPFGILKYIKVISEGA